jgi:hypothetical protein
MGRKKKANGSNGAGLNGQAAVGLSAPPPDTRLEDLAGFSERAQQIFLAHDYETIDDLIGASRADLLGLDGATEALVDHVVEQLAAIGWKLSADPAAAEPPPPAPTPKLTRFFARKLTDKERGALSGQLMRAALQRKALQDKIDECGRVRAGLKKEQDTITSRLTELAEQRKTGTVNDEIECYEREERDPTGEDVRPGVGLFRSDTDERVNWRPLATHERQGELFSEGEKVFPAAAQ